MTDTGYFVVDTSAVVAVLSDELGADWLAEAFAQATAAVSATYLELGMVLESRFGPSGTGAAGRFLRDAEIEIVEVTARAAERALESWRDSARGDTPPS